MIDKLVTGKKINTNLQECSQYLTIQYKFFNTQSHSCVKLNTRESFTIWIKQKFQAVDLVEDQKERLGAQMTTTQS